MLAQINSIFYDYNLEISNFDDLSLNLLGAKRFRNY